MLRLSTRGHTGLFFSHRINPRQSSYIRIQRVIKPCLIQRNLYHTTPLPRDRFSQAGGEGVLKIARQIHGWDQSASLYLPNEAEAHLFRKNFGSESIEDKRSPHHHFISALAHEERGAFLEAMEDYLQLSENNPHAIQCIEKAYGLLQKISLYNQDFLNRKEGVRIAFEKCLVNLDRYSPQEKAPTCFVCFNVSEKDVGQWLEETLVPDLDLAGIKPIFCFRDLSQGEDLDNFQELARSADLVIIACTPDLKTKYEERKKAPVGVAQEIRMIKGRYNDEDKAHTIFPIYLKGTRKESLPTAYFESIFGAKFSPFNGKHESFEFNYFSNAFDLFSAMRKISREDSRKFRALFLQEAKQIMRGEVDTQEIEHWREEGKNRVQALHTSIAHRISQHTQMVNLPLPPKDFTGRERELLDLHVACKHKHRVALTGLGGMGKTALALQYGENYKSYYQFIHFVRAGTSEQIVEGLLKLADDLHIPPSETPQERLQWLKIRLDRLEQEYLLIFDGIDQTESFSELEKYFPERGGRLLLTSRMPEEARIRGFEIIRIKPLPIEEAIKYVLLATGSQDDSASKELVEKVGCLPLALKHAVGYIRSGAFTIQAYIDMWNKYELQLFEDKFLALTKEEKTILKTWEISMEAMENQSPLAKKLLEFLAFMGQASIPLDLIKSWFENSHSETPELELNHALKCLCDYSMIDSSSVGGYDIHALVQNVTRYQMSLEDQQIVFQEALEAVTLQIGQFDEEDISTWSYPKICMPHAKSLTKMQDLMKTFDLEIQYKFLSLLRSLYEKHGDTYQALELQKECIIIIEEWASAHNIDVDALLSDSRSDEKGVSMDQKTFMSPFYEYFRRWFENPDLEEVKSSLAIGYSTMGAAHHNFGEQHKALEFHQKSLKIQLQILGENHPNVATSYNNIGIGYNALGELSKALEFHQKSLKIKLQVLGENHSNVAISYNNIGAIYSSLCEKDKALEYYQKSLKIQLQILGENHPDVASSYSNIGNVYSVLGKKDKAHEYYQKSLQIWLQVSVENHPDVATNYDSIGLAYSNLGQEDTALEYYQKALKIRLQDLGENHPSVAISYSTIGRAYYNLGEGDKALEFQRKGLKIQLQVLGENHPNVASIYEDIGLAYRSLKEPDKALEFHQKGLKIQLQVLGEDHPDVAKSYNGIGLAYSSLKEPDKALEYYQKSLKIQLQVLGENHLDVAESYNDIGLAYSNLKELDKALEYYQKSLRIHLLILGENHPDIASIYQDIGLAYYRLDEPDKALEYYQKSLRIQLQVLGENHLDVAGSYSNIGLVYSNLKEPDKALEYYQKSLKVQLQVLGEDHLDVAGSYSNIGRAYYYLREPDKALEYYQKSLRIHLLVLGENHPDVAGSYSNVGLTYSNLKEPDKALEYYQKSLKIQLQVLGENHPAVATSYNNIGAVYSELGEQHKALEYYQKSLEVQLQVLGENHPDVARSYSNIGRVYNNLGEQDKALEYYQKSLKVQLQVLGENHPDVAISYTYVGLAYYHLREPDKALEYYQKSLKIQLQVLGENHFDVAGSYNNMGLAHYYCGKQDKALEFHQKSLKIRLQVLEENHPDVATSYSNIAATYNDLEENAQALEYYQKSLKIQLQLLGEDHLDVAISYNNIGFVYYKLGEDAPALEFYQKSLKIKLQVLGENHPDVATLRGNIAYFNHKLGKG